MVFNNINFYFETSNIYKEKFAIEYNINNILFCRVGKASYNNLTYGIGLNSSIFEFNYAYSYNIYEEYNEDEFKNFATNFIGFRYTPTEKLSIFSRNLIAMGIVRNALISRVPCH